MKEQMKKKNRNLSLPFFSLPMSFTYNLLLKVGAQMSQWRSLHYPYLTNKKTDAQWPWLVYLRARPKITDERCKIRSLRSNTWLLWPTTSFFIPLSQGWDSLCGQNWGLWKWQSCHPLGRWLRHRKIYPRGPYRVRSEKTWLRVLTQPCKCFVSWGMWLSLLLFLYF